MSYRVWKFPWQKQLTAVAASAKEIYDLKLSNYPNPAVSATTISFILTQPALISFRMQDALGRTIKNMDLSWSTSDIHSLGLDISDLTRGVYYSHILQTEKYDKKNDDRIMLPNGFYQRIC